MLSQTRTLALAVGVVAAAAAARGEVVFSTLGPGGSFSSFDRFEYLVGPTAQVMEVGFAFTPTASGPLTELRAPLMSLLTPTTFRLSVYRDTGTLPGELLGQTLVSPPVVSGNPVLGAYALPAVRMDAGVRYFLSLQRESGTGGWVWHRPFPQATGWRFEHWPNTPWLLYTTQSTAAFEVSIPAPGWVGVLAGVAVGRRRRRAWAAPFV